MSRISSSAASLETSCPEKVLEQSRDSLSKKMSWGEGVGGSGGVRSHADNVMIAENRRMLRESLFPILVELHDQQES
ncbi:hypothetical protein [Parasphingorhabdus marina]|uniref:hypothetical protein n=1 Tax=Parasphingorhabdus marina TaxID=394732 RepID=UPI001EF6CB8F|nr:hypothetical protein [Parasphingorhabdus marina]